jgi:Bacterial protein of unknown function (Gcw_chp)
MLTSRGWWRTLLQSVAMATIVLGSDSAAAREDEIEPVAPSPPEVAAGKFDMAIGIAGTTDYVSRGITQTGNDPAIQGYIEPSYGLGPVLGDAFVNVWASNVDFCCGFDGTEIDVAGGIRNGRPTSVTCTISMHRKISVRTMEKSTPRPTIRLVKTIGSRFVRSSSLRLTSVKPALMPLGSQAVEG